MIGDETKRKEYDLSNRRMSQGSYSYSQRTSYQSSYQPPNYGYTYTPPKYGKLNGHQLNLLVTQGSKKFYDHTDAWDENQYGPSGMPRGNKNRSANSDSNYNYQYGKADQQQQKYQQQGSKTKQGPHGPETEYNYDIYREFFNTGINRRRHSRPMRSTNASFWTELFEGLETPEVEWNGSMDNFPGIFHMNEIVTNTKSQVLLDVTQKLGAGRTSIIGRVVFGLDKESYLDLIDRQGKILATASRDRHQKEDIIYVRSSSGSLLGSAKTQYFQPSFLIDKFPVLKKYFHRHRVIVDNVR